MPPGLRKKLPGASSCRSDESGGGGLFCANAGALIAINTAQTRANSRIWAPYPLNKTKIPDLQALVNCFANDKAENRSIINLFTILLRSTF
jgi:hypothetical protein